MSEQVSQIEKVGSKVITSFCVCVFWFFLQCSFCKLYLPHPLEKKQIKELKLT